MSANAPRRRAAGELETAVLKALWDAPGPLNPTELQARIAPDLAYNTVHTVLTRMCDKGLLTHSRSGNRSAYAAAQAPAEHGAARLHAVLDDDDDHLALLRRFVATLSPEDADFLRSVLADGAEPGAGTGA